MPKQSVRICERTFHIDDFASNASRLDIPIGWTHLVKSPNFPAPMEFRESSRLRGTRHALDAPTLGYGVEILAKEDPGLCVAQGWCPWRPHHPRTA
jgi:hypothetical protein